MIICISGFVIGNSFPQTCTSSDLYDNMEENDFCVRSTSMSSCENVNHHQFDMCHQYDVEDKNASYEQNENDLSCTNMPLHVADYANTSPASLQNNAMAGLCHNVSKSQILYKKSSIYNADGMKRNRILNAYELSQYLLDKQIELLERKYGGDKARNAALIIQRAFRRYTLIKKFTYITTMAQQDKKYADQKSVQRLPSRSMSLRETNRTYILKNNQTDSNSDMNLSLDLSNNSSHPHVNILHYEYDLYMRGELSGSRKKIPPEVPKRTSSISNRSCKPNMMDGRQNYEQMQSNYDHQGSPNSTLSRSTYSDNLQMRPTLSENSLVRSNISEQQQNCMDTNGRQNYGHTPQINMSNLCEYTQYRPNYIENGSVCSVQSSGSDNSIHYENYERGSSSPVWKKIEQAATNDYTTQPAITVNAVPATQNYKTNETIRKRQYRVGLNLFNKKPDKGIQYLIQKQFLENSSYAIAKFLITRKGLSKKIIGEFLGDLQNPLSQKVLLDFSNHLDFSNMELDIALRKFMSFFRIPGEAQKIEKIIEVFSKRYIACNFDLVNKFQNADTIFILSFAIIMLNTDLHTPNLKPEKRMKLEDFIKNLRNIDNGRNIDKNLLTGIYERVKANEFKCSSDHVTQVMKVQQTIAGNKPNLALSHRRLVCYCRLYEIPDLNKKERIGVHQREVFLFNDLLVITKILSKKKNCVSYTFRNSLPLSGINVALFETTHYPFGIRLTQRVDGKVLIIFNARNEHDRIKFADDLKESILEMNEMENIRIENELERQKRSNRNGSEPNRDSGVADLCNCQTSVGHNHPSCNCQQVVSSNLNNPNQFGNNLAYSDQQLKRSALSNSLLDMHEQLCDSHKQRRGSVGSLDSGMSLSFTNSSHRQQQQQQQQQYNASHHKLQQNVIYNIVPQHQPTSMLHQQMLHTMQTLPLINLAAVQHPNPSKSVQHFQYNSPNETNMLQHQHQHQLYPQQKRERKTSRTTEV